MFVEYNHSFVSAGDGKRRVPPTPSRSANRHSVLGRAERALRGADLPGRHVLGQVQRGRAAAAFSSGEDKKSYLLK